MSLDKEDLFILLDLIISEYGWSIEYCLKLPQDIIFKLAQQIQKRRRENYKFNTKLMAIAVSLGFSGKIDQVDKIFSDNLTTKEDIDPNVWKSQVKNLWFKTKSGGANLSADEFKKLEAQFEKDWSDGNIKM